LSKKFADSLLQPLQEVSSRLRTLSRSTAADSTCEGFDLAQSVGFSLAPTDDVAKRMMVRTIRRGRLSCCPARTPIARFVHYIGATATLL
jgi:hypothetical protein